MRPNAITWAEAAQERIYELQFAFARITGFGVAARVRFYNKLARAMERRQNIKQVLEKMRYRLELKADSRRLVLRRWIAELNNGSTFSAATEGFLPASERMMLAAGEVNGNVALGFRSAEYLATAARRIRGAMAGALAYPIGLLIMLGVLLYVASFKLLPIMEGILPVEEWPMLARGFHALTSYVQNFGLITVLLFLVGIVVAVRTMPTWGGDLRAWLDGRIPPWTIYREIQSSSVLIALAAILDAGDPIDDAIEMQRRMAPPWLQKHLSNWLKNMRAGQPPGQAANTGLFGPAVQEDLEDYTDSGSLEEAMKDIGKYVIEDTIERITKQAWILNGVILVLVTATLLWMYGSMTMIGMAIQSASSRGTL